MTKLANENEIFSDEDLIYSYTRKDAIEDGNQFLIPEELTKQAGYVYPVYATGTIYNIIERNARSNKFEDFKGIIWDILITLKIAIKLMKDSPEVQFRTIINRKEYIFYSQIGATDIDDPKPAITIMTEADL
ncbi:MAG: hypothetical protein ACYDBV_13420 [Nitrospiria bacterium]